MRIHEFGQKNEKVIVLIHPSVVMWDYFEYVIPLLEKKYHLIIPALPGYDPDMKSDFLLIYTGKLGGTKLLEKAFSTDELSGEDVQYTAKVLKMIRIRTIWRTFESCNNFSMPDSFNIDCRHIEY